MVIYCPVYQRTFHLHALHTTKKTNHTLSKRYAAIVHFVVAPPRIAPQLRA